MAIHNRSLVLGGKNPLFIQKMASTQPENVDSATEVSKVNPDKKFPQLVYRRFADLAEAFD